MRKLVVDSFVTLDGVAQGPGGPEEDRENGFTLGGWMGPFMEEEFMRFVSESTLGSGALLLGRKTYDIFAAHWPNTPADDAIGVHFNRIPKYVASRKRRTLSWSGTTQLEGNVAEAVAALKREPGGDIQVWGSSDLVQTLIEHDLVDEYRLSLVPVLIGSGKRLFGDGTIPQSLRMIESRATAKGVVLAKYAPAGAIEQMTVGT